ncbi:MAG: type II secretion system protein [Eubacterium sp.]|nr:type II secretion system protein [Eubacterium sp.]
MKKTNNKGFTLVELIVVLVILAILAAILVPALLGYIDKAREKQVTTNAEAAYVAAQALATEYYGKNKDVTFAKMKAYVTDAQIKKLTDIAEDFDCAVVKSADDSATDKKCCIIDEFTYNNGKYKATWHRTASTDGSYDAGGWVVTEDTTAVTAD